jgi:hypothetical protein
VRSYLYLGDQSWDVKVDAKMDVDCMNNDTEYVLPNSEK